MEKKGFGSRIKPYGMIAPAMTGIVLFTLYPAFDLVRLSLQDVNMLNSAKTKFVGLRNYREIFAREAFHKALLNTAVYTTAVVILIIGLALLLAVCLNQKKSKLNDLVLASAFSPHVISIVSVSIVWLWMMDPTHGLFNYIIQALGLPALKWLSSSKTSMMSVILISVWKEIGYDTLLLLAGLRSVPQEIYDAASLDTSSRATVFFRITLPLISPQLFFTLIIRTISSFKVFDTIRILTQGGPNNSTITLGYEVYKESLLGLRIGYGATVGVILMAITGALTILYFALLSKKVFYQ